MRGMKTTSPTGQKVGSHDRGGITPGGGGRRHVEGTNSRGFPGMPGRPTPPQLSESSRWVRGGERRQSPGPAAVAGERGRHPTAPA